MGGRLVGCGLKSLVFAGALALTGCGGTVGYATVTSAPYDIYYGYPYSYYDGRVVYLVGDRWMYQDRGSWYSYRTPPPAIYQNPIYRAPPSYRYYGPGPGVAPYPSRPYPYQSRPYIQQAPAAPPAMRSVPGRQAAPPAYRR